MTIAYSIQSRFSFDTSWLEDLYEEIVFEVQANKVLPLIINPGRVLLTTSRIYFQPYNNMAQVNLIGCVNFQVSSFIHILIPVSSAENQPERYKTRNKEEIFASSSGIR